MSVQQLMLAAGLLAFAMLNDLMPRARAETYNMVKEYAGSSFFNDWAFFDHCTCHASASKLILRC